MAEIMLWQLCLHWMPVVSLATLTFTLHLQQLNKDVKNQVNKICVIFRDGNNKNAVYEWDKMITSTHDNSESLPLFEPQKQLVLCDACLLWVDWNKWHDNIISRAAGA